MKGVILAALCAAIVIFAQSGKEGQPIAIILGLVTFYYVFFGYILPGLFRFMKWLMWK